MAPRKSASKATAAPVVPAVPREVRLWAADHGYTVSPRGRIRKEVLAAFTQDTGRPVTVLAKV